MTAPTNADSANDIVAWYAMPVDEAVKRLATNTDKGLGATEASSRLEKYGPNRLPEGKRRGPFMRFVSQFNNILVFVLLGAGFTKLMLNLWVDASIIFGVVSFSTRCSVSCRKARPRKPWTRSAICCPHRRGPSVTVKRG